MRQQTWISAEPTRGFLGAGQDIALWQSLLGNVSPLYRILVEAPDDPYLN
jgi:hypothetical protein